MSATVRVTLPRAYAWVHGTEGAGKWTQYGPGETDVPPDVAAALERAGVLTLEEKTPLETLLAGDILDLPIRELNAALQGVDDPDALAALAAREAAGKDRSGALAAIEARRAALEDA